MIDYRETGERQTISDFGASVRLSVRTGNPDRAVELLSREGGDFQMGAYGATARTHVVERLADFLGDDPQYQALLAEAGITW
jgi:hypothetical protein